MADFNLALPQTLRWESKILEQVPNDPGGLTFWGIAHNVHPEWSGWPTIDTYMEKAKTLKGAELLANQDTALIDLVTKFYKANYWDNMMLDQVNNQSLANNIHDTAVNMGLGFAIRMLQNCIGQIEVTGIIDAALVQMLNNIMDLPSFIKLYQDERAIKYRTLVERRPVMAKFLNGWLKRAYAIK